jgi:hypothetical protein
MFLCALLWFKKRVGNLKTIDNPYRSPAPSLLLPKNYVAYVSMCPIVVQKMGWHADREVKKKPVVRTGFFCK